MKRWRERVRVPDDVAVRVGSALLWTLVAVAAIGGLVAWWRPAPAPVVPSADSASEAAVTAEAWDVAGFAERFIAAWLRGEVEPNGGDVTAEAVEETVGSPALRAAGLELVADGVWAVTVAETTSEESGERFWRVGVTVENGALGALGWPTPAAAPATPTRVESSGVGSLGSVPAEGDPLQEAVEGFVLAQACGAGPLERWLAPGAHVDAVAPAICETVELTGWSATPADDQTHQTVVVEAVLESHVTGPRTVSYGLVLDDRQGRWEVTALLSALPVQAGEAP